MEDISTLIWLGIAILWFITRLIRRGAKKVARSQQQRPSRTAAPPAPSPGQPMPQRSRGRPDDFGRGGTGPPPIEPR